MYGKRFFCVIYLSLLVLFLLNGGSAFTVWAAETSYGSAGRIAEAERAPELGDTSNWLTLQAGDSGVRVVSKDGVELIAVDNFGGIYLNGDVYLNQKLLETDSNQLANGFLYLLLVISLALNLWSVCKIKKISGKRGGA